MKVIYKMRFHFFTQCYVGILDNAHYHYFGIGPGLITRFPGACDVFRTTTTIDKENNTYTYYDFNILHVDVRSSEKESTVR